MSDKKDKSIIEVFIDTFVEYVTEDIQEVLEILNILSDDLESEGDSNE